MTADDVMARLRPPSYVRCSNCAGSSGHPPLEGDGALICLPCLYRLGRAAGSPETLTNTEVLVLCDLHGDVVELRGSGAGIFWHWRAA